MVPFRYQVRNKVLKYGIPKPRTCSPLLPDLLLSDKVFVSSSSFPTTEFSCS